MLLSLSPSRNRRDAEAAGRRWEDAWATDNWLLSVEMLRASRGRTLFEKREL
jgi:hypothetical protein